MAQAACHGGTRKCCIAYTLTGKGFGRAGGASEKHTEFSCCSGSAGRSAADAGAALLTQPAGERPQPENVREGTGDIRAQLGQQQDAQLQLRHGRSDAGNKLDLSF